MSAVAEVEDDFIAPLVARTNRGPSAIRVGVKRKGDEKTDAFDVYAHLSHCSRCTYISSALVEKLNLSTVDRDVPVTMQTLLKSTQIVFKRVVPQVNIFLPMPGKTAKLGCGLTNVLVMENGKRDLQLGMDFFLATKSSTRQYYDGFYQHLDSRGKPTKVPNAGQEEKEVFLFQPNAQMSFDIPIVHVDDGEKASALYNVNESPFSIGKWTSPTGEEVDYVGDY